MVEHRYLWITNNFMHDLATGVWAACLLVVPLLRDRMAGAPADAVTALAGANTMLFRLAIVALIVIAATGGVRLGYWRRLAEPGAVAEKRRALLIKHAAFAVLFGSGTAWLWWMVR